MEAEHPALRLGVVKLIISDDEHMLVRAEDIRRVRRQVTRRDAAIQAGQMYSNADWTRQMMQAVLLEQDMRLQQQRREEEQAARYGNGWNGITQAGGGNQIGQLGGNPTKACKPRLPSLARLTSRNGSRPSTSPSGSLAMTTG